MMSYQSSLSREKAMAVGLSQVEITMISVWNRGLQFCVAHDFSHVCFVSKQNPLAITTSKPFIYYGNAFIMSRHCLDASLDLEDIPRPLFHMTFE